MAVIWIICYTFSLFSKLFMVAMGRITLNKLKFFYDLIMVLVFQVTIKDV